MDQQNPREDSFQSISDESSSHDNFPDSSDLDEILADPISDDPAE